MSRKKIIASVAAAAILVIGAGSAGIAYATGDNSTGQTSGDDAAGQTESGDTGHPATGPDVEKAKSIALNQTNGGRVTATEVPDEEGYYEIEVTLDDGSQVDVHLDKNFNVLDSKADHEDSGGHDGPDDQDGPNDD